MVVNPPADFANTESWNGSSWTETTDLNTARDGMAGVWNIQHAIARWSISRWTVTANTESWNGSSWTEVKI